VRRSQVHMCRNSLRLKPVAGDLQMTSFCRYVPYEYEYEVIADTHSSLNQTNVASCTE
jgi:hypothetical protein